MISGDKPAQGPEGYRWYDCLDCMIAGEKRELDNRREVKEQARTLHKAQRAMDTAVTVGKA